MNKIDYDKLFESECKLWSGQKLLLHCCCAPCTTAVIERLKGKFDITLFYYNPNIMPESEYFLRLDNLKKLAQFHSLPLVSMPYEPSEFLSFASSMHDSPEGGARCNRCIALRLNKSVEYARQNGFTLITSTLTVSPHKNALFINEYGEKAWKEGWLHSDFKKKNGFLRSTEISKELGLYRQNYCGCKL